MKERSRGYKIRHRRISNLGGMLRRRYEKGFDYPRNLYDSREFLESEAGVELVREKLRKMYNRRHGIAELGDLLMWRFDERRGIVGEMREL